MFVIVILIVISTFLKRYSKAKRTRATAYSRALRRIKGGFPNGGSREAQVRLVKRSSSPMLQMFQLKRAYPQSMNFRGLPWDCFLFF